jgi:hypothetical protein
VHITGRITVHITGRINVRALRIRHVGGSAGSGGFVVTGGVLYAAFDTVRCYVRRRAE